MPSLLLVKNTELVYDMMTMVFCRARKIELESEIAKKMKNSMTMGHSASRGARFSISFPEMRPLFKPPTDIYLVYIAAAPLGLLYL